MANPPNPFDSDPPDRPGADAGDLLLAAVRRALRPLVRLLVAKQITYPTLSALLKSVYVDVAERDFALASKRQTDSRISLLSGVHRKDVARLRGGPAEAATPRSVSLGAQLVARWLGDPSLSDAAGRPIPLPRQARAAGEPCFDALAESVSKDIRARALLDELLRVGVVSQDAAGLVRLEVESFVASDGDEEQLFYFGRNLRDHVAAAAHNVLGEAEPHFERSVYYAQLSPAAVAELAELAREQGTAALHAVNRRALELQRRDAGRSDASKRMSFGAYFYDAPVEDAAAPAAPSGGDDDV